MNGVAYLYLFLAGGTGVVARFLSTKAMASIFGMVFPYGTLAVNVIGSFLFGFLSWYVVHRWAALANVETLRIVVLTGLLGGYTTFSAFSMELLQMVLSGNYAKACLYVGLSVVVCVIACFVGLLFAEQLV